MGQARGGKSLTAKQKKELLNRMGKSGGSDLEDASFIITNEELKIIVGDEWYAVLMWIEEHPDKPVVNIFATTSKSARKSIVFAAFLIYLLGKHPWLQGAAARATKDMSSTELITVFQNVRRFLYDEYKIAWATPEIITESKDGIYLIRDRKRKDNQRIPFTSFEELVTKGGFTDTTAFFWEELVDNKFKKKPPTKEDFLDDYNFIATKNKENFITRGKDYYAFPTHFFALNRWDTNHPIIQFQEDHIKWQRVKEWMLVDLVKNNFFVYYVEKANPGWKGFDHSLIVYASKFSNHLLTGNANWLREQKELVAEGKQRNLGIILGDVFEGNVKTNNTYGFGKTFVHKKLPIAPFAVTYGTDRDIHDEIVITPKYLLKFDDIRTLEKYKRPVIAAIAGPQRILKMKGMNLDDTSRAIMIKTWLKRSFLDLQKNSPVPKGKKAVSYLDDDQSVTVADFNIDKDLKKELIVFAKAKKHGSWGIHERQDYMEDARMTGFESTLIGNEVLEREYHICMNKEKEPIRNEDPGANKLNKINSDEYSSYIARGYKHRFPEGFWEFYYEDKKDKL